ncbi:ABC transporter ATP-binding protein [Peristeroidobacter agariperforans]|uniref:ABC transporter ATP-binding protein n=1 Tax=Peristeroidobacter agariperforans TaxID=268404 RepID=UPI00101CD04D|nr:sn-glycerol-3-phosphate ABC transporter ATP-binding protein UgpC [Peristeroidobacter agariperforans]
MAAVKLKAVRKVYSNGHVGVDSASFDIADGELLVLVGPSGCGKSTLLRLIAGLEEATAGSIHIGDVDVTNLEPRDRDIAMVFQSYALYPHMTVRENLGFGLKLRGHSDAEVAERVKDAADRLELETMLDRLPKQLSGGQRQRVALGRALVRHPKVFLLDEPLSNLDAKLRSAMRTEIARLHRSLQTTMVYVTHDQVEAMTLGQRIVVLDRGIVQQIDTPMNIYERPVNLFVAGFLGNPAMNFFRGSLNSAGNVLNGEGAELAVPPGLPAGKTIVVGIRPEDLQRIDGASPPGNIRLAVLVDLIETVGNEAFIHASVGAWRIIVRSSPYHLPPLGSTITLQVMPERLHFFDAESGQRIAPTS